MKNGERYKSAKERLDAFRDLCNRCGTLMEVSEFAQWLDLEVEEEKPMPCPFCGGHCYVQSTIPECNHYVQCGSTECWYSGGRKTNRDEAIAAHNQVCKAVAAYKEGEVM